MKLILHQFKQSRWVRAYDYIELLAKGMVGTLPISAMTFRKLMGKMKLIWLNTTRIDSGFKAIELC